MQIKSWAQGSAILIVSLFTANIAFAQSDAAQSDAAENALTQIDADAGTYEIRTVSTIEECTAICEADKRNCRGSTVIYQLEVENPEIECRLNNGIGEDPAFQQAPPEDLDFNKALSDLNAYRISKNRAPLIYDERLNKASQLHSRDLANAEITSHTGTDGSSSGDRIQRQGYYFSISGENVATGQRSWEAVFEAWKTSEGHNKNMLRNDVSEFGLGFVYEPKSYPETYWTMTLAEPLNIDGSEN